jgi:hypothetical protein
MIWRRGWNRAAPWLGAVAGFCAGVMLSRTISMAARPGQLPGIAATLGFDPHGYFWRLVVLVACPIAGGFLAAWIARADEAGWDAEVVTAPAPLSRTAAILLGCTVAALFAAARISSPAAVNLYEDGHGLLPASEYLRGELPYRGIVPGHGLISDGLLQATGLRIFGDDYRGYNRTETLAAALFWPSLCVLAFVATGSAAAAFGSLLLTFLAYSQPGYLRVIPSLWILALALAASRSGKGRFWFACGALVPIALLVAVEFAAYAAGAALVALWVARGPRLRHLGRFAAGAAVSSAVIAFVFAAVGFFGGFVETTFLFLPTLMPAYAIPLVRPALPWSPEFRSLGAFLADPTMFLYGFVTLAALVLGAVLPRGGRIGDRARAALPILAWIVFAMVSVVERRHVRYPMFLVPLALVLLALWFKNDRRWSSPRGLAAAAALTLVIVLWKPWDLAHSMSSSFTHRLSPALPTFEEPRRARGGSFPPADAALVRATNTLIREAKLSSDETWLDFANAPGLYYLFDRNCPIRYYEVPFYESPSAQEEVVATLERNEKVRAVLVASGLPSDPIDGVPNAARAPKVAKFLELNFQPFLKQDGVEWWLRRSSP